MSGAALAILLFFGLGIGGGLLLYLLVVAEYDRDVMDRESAEQAARRDRREP